jgi:hypothetical protein
MKNFEELRKKYLQNYNSENDLPSHNITLLKKLQGLVIRKMERLSHFSPEKIMKTWNTPPHMLFSLCGGTLLITFDTRLVVSFGSDPSLVSVTIVEEYNEKGELINPAEIYFPDEHESYCINAMNKIYSNNSMKRFINQEIVGIQLIKRLPDFDYFGRPCEVGIVLDTNVGKLLLSHGLYERGDDFAVITPEMIHPDIQKEIQINQLM